jgi:competence protein ComFB
MALRDSYDFDSLVNEAERLVLRELESRIAADPGICRCQDCVLDMAAFALNNVKPSYRVSLMGSVYARAGTPEDYVQDIRRAVDEAVKKVTSNPSHD